MAHKTLLYIDHEITTAIAEPKLIPVEAVVVFFIDIIFSFFYSLTNEDKFNYNSNYSNINRKH